MIRQQPWFREIVAVGWPVLFYWAGVLLSLAVFIFSVLLTTENRFDNEDAVALGAFRYLVKRRKKLKLKGVYWYAWKDTNPKGNNCSFCYTIGLFRHNRNKLVAKPAWRKFVRFSRGRP